MFRLRLGRFHVIGQHMNIFSELIYDCIHDIVAAHQFDLLPLAVVHPEH